MTTEIKEVPQEAKTGDFGCVNCLWASIECKSGSMYVPKEKSKQCDNYTYYD